MAKSVLKEVKSLPWGADAVGYLNAIEEFLASDLEMAEVDAARFPGTPRNVRSGLYAQIYRKKLGDRVKVAFRDGRVFLVRVTEDDSGETDGERVG